MKLKYALLEKLLTLTNKEIDFLMFVIRYQDPHGRVTGLYYRDICKAIGICKQTFYNTLQSLKKKGIITYSHSDLTHDFDITILGNDFSYPGAYEEGYVNVSRRAFHTQRFSDLKAKEKVLLLLFLRVTHENSSSYQIGTKKFYDKYMKLLGVAKRVLRGYLHSLKKFFSIGVKDGKYFITYLASVFDSRLQQSESSQQQEHLVKVRCRRSKVKEVDPAEVKETARLINQYKSDAELYGLNIIELLLSAISRSVEGKRDASLSARTVHWHLRVALGFEKKPAIY